MEHTSYDGYAPSGSPRRPDIMHRSSSSTRSQSGEIEQVVTKLLRTTKALLEALTQWSQQRASTAEILDFRETLETQFHLVSQAFEDAGVAMSDLSWIPRQLKESVSAAMNEEPSPATLDQHLPRIRDVIVHLLHGLKGKQQQLRERDAAQMSQTSWSRDSYRSTDSWRREIPQAALARGANLTHSPPGSRPLYSSDRSPPPVAARLTGSDYDPRMGMPRPSVSPENVNRMNYPPQPPRPYSPTAGMYGHYPMPQAPRMPSPSRSSSSSGGDGRPSSASSAGRGYPAQTAVDAAVVGAAPPPPPPPPPSSANTLKPPSNDFDESDPNTASALAALKRQENLARRSSVRRASMFRGNGAGDYHPMKRQGPNDYVPPVPSIPARAALQDGKKLGTVEEGQAASDEGSSGAAEQDTKEKGMILFLGIGKDVKKVHYTGELSIPALRMLFIERFGYSSGLSDFPSIYIKDPVTNISYELEDLEDVKNNSVLSLNIDDAKDDKKEAHIYWAQEMNAAMEKEMSEIRKMFVEQVETIKQQLSDMQAQAPPPTPQPEPPTPTISTQHQSATVSTDTLANSTEDVSQATVSVRDIKAQLRHVETLRRDMAVLRQLQREMRQDADTTVQELKNKLHELREKDKAEPKQTSQSEARAFIEEGKEKLLTSSDKITARLEDLQDTIDQLKLDVTQRKCRPSEAQMAHCKKEKAIVAQEIEEFGAYIVNVKPRWKKTWEQELQTIVKEQQMLKEQEGLLLDMQDDLTALVEVFEQLEKICAYQAKAKPVVREFHVAPAEDGFEGMSSVLKQVATIDVDHERRLRALDQAEKMRQRELDNRIDEFERELTDFVDSKKLKKTGGAEEIERLRQQKEKELLRQLYMEGRQGQGQAQAQEQGQDQEQEKEKDQEE